MGHVKLFIPGPIEVSAKTLAAFAKPVIGHRSQAFKDLYAKIQPRLQQLFFTKQPVFISTSSAWGVMEGSIRNLVNKKVLCCGNGAFSDKWLDVSLRCGKDAEALTVDWGSPVRGAAIEEKLATGEFDTVTFIHNETSTGTQSPLAEISAVKKKYPNVMFIVDTVSSMSGQKIPVDELGFDVVLCGVQKAFALPPGMALFTVSEAAFERAASVKGRGYYFDFLEFKKNGDKSMTPSTPVINHIYALESKLDEIFTEGLDARFARHQKLADMTRGWALKHGFTLFPDEGYESVTLTCVNNGARPEKGGRIIDVEKFVKLVKAEGFLINGGYGKIKGTTFRVSNMGDETPETMNELFAAMDKAIAQL